MPKHVSSTMRIRGINLIPITNSERPHYVLLSAGAEHLVHVHLLDEHTELLELGVRHVFHRHGDAWLGFNVTAAVMLRKPRAQLRLLVHIRAAGPHNQFDLTLVANPVEGRQFQDVQPLLLLSYSALTVISCFCSYASFHYARFCCPFRFVAHRYIVSFQGFSYNGDITRPTFCVSVRSK